MFNKDRSKFDTRLKLKQVLAIGALGILGSAGSVAFLNSEEAPALPSVNQLTHDGPFQKYIVRPGDSPVDIAEQYGKGPNSALTGIITEQENNGIMTPGNVEVIPKKFTDPQDYARMAGQTAVAEQLTK